MTQEPSPESESNETIYDQMVERYQAGDLPWDSELPPPKVTDLADSMSPGRALDLGCGYGRASIFLASRGWTVDAIDFVSQAIAEAKTRARKAGVKDRIGFYLASVADLGFLNQQYDLALDVGCLHVLTGSERQNYYRGLLRLLANGAHFLLFTRLQQDGAENQEEPPGLTERDVRALFAEGFVLDRVAHGETQLPDGSSWASSWFWYRRVTTADSAE